MFARLRSAFSLIALLLATTAMGAQEGAADRHNCNMFPKNSLRIPISDGIDSINETGVSQKQFMQVLDLVERAYAPEVAARGAKLVVVRNWTNAEVNAFADRSPDNKIWTINIYGGLARHPAMTPEGLLLVACHEIGHQIGEAPHYPGEWAATEGQSDYFATLKCMRKVLDPLDNRKALRNLTSRISKDIEQRCARFHNQAKDADGDGMAICIRSVKAAESLGATLAAVTNVERAKRNLPPRAVPRPETPDKSVAPKTIVDGYPELQCRVDTYVNGATCAVGVATALDPVKPNAGVCLRPARTLRREALASTSIVDALSARPACWYNQDEMENYKRVTGPAIRRPIARR